MKKVDGQREQRSAEPLGQEDHRGWFLGEIWLRRPEALLLFVEGSL